MQANILLEPIRLVIWDLDETFWRGTLTEGGIIEHLGSAEAAVRELARRGIISSICSKNDFDAVRTILVERGLWDLFVFSSIDWTGKGSRVAGLVRDVQLRPESVLFIDDNASNRAEVCAAVPGIQTSDETIVDTLLADPRLRGKDDDALSRLQHYRQMEARHKERQRDKGDAAEFLRSSRIIVEIGHDVETDIERVVEIINRTNQLNFTKKRLPEDMEDAKTELRSQINATPGRRAGIVRVTDRFGDHGIVGFWMMDGIWVEPYLIHFAFSCRTIGMGVEQWVYSRLGRPKLEISGDVVADLDGTPEWINANKHEYENRTSDSVAPPSVRLRGGCELEVVRHFFAFASADVSGTFVHPRDGQTVWPSHIATLFKQPAARTIAGAEALASIGFCAEDLESDFLSPVSGPMCLVLSNSADAHVPLYRHRTLDLVVPAKLFGIDLTAPIDEAAITRFCAANGLESDRKERFAGWVTTLHRDWAPIAIADVPLGSYYERLFSAVPDGALLVVLVPITFANASDGGVIEFPEQDAANRILRGLAAGRPNVRLVETADCVRSRDELRKLSHLHFARDVYHRIFERISAAWASTRDTDV